MNNPKLKPCPFCGGTPYQDDLGSHGYYTGEWIVQCLGCQANVMAGSEGASTRKWNRRTIKQEESDE